MGIITIVELSTEAIIALFVALIATTESERQLALFLRRSAERSIVGGRRCFLRVSVQFILSQPDGFEIEVESMLQTVVVEAKCISLIAVDVLLRLAGAVRLILLVQFAVVAQDLD